MSFTIGFIGTGIMGHSMASHLLSSKYSLFVYNRTLEKCTSLVSLGATLAGSIPELVSFCDIIITMLGYPSDVHDVILGEDGVMKYAKTGSIIIDMTTSEPVLAKNIFEIGQKKGVMVLDAPVSGGDVGAKNATLTIFAGGEREVVEKVRPVLEKMGKKITYCGAAGSGQHVKMVNQILIASTMIGVCEGLVYGYRAGIDLDMLIEAVGAGAAGSWSISNLGPRIVARNFEPGFMVDHFLKDMSIAISEANRMNLTLPGLALANQLYLSVKELGYGRKGTQALALALESMNNMCIKRD